MPSGLLKNAHLLRFPCLPAGRLILPRVKHGAGLLRRTTSSTRRLSLLRPQDFGRLASGHF